MNDDGMLHKIKALLYKAERAATPEEAMAYSAKAAELMEKYAIDQALLDATRPRSERDKPTVYTETFEGVAYAPRKLVLFYLIAESGGCKCLRIDSSKVAAYGFQSDIDNAKLLYYSILVQAERELARTRVPSNVSARSFRTSWWAAYTHRIVQRVKEAADRTKQEASKEPSTALVLRDRSLEVKGAFSEAHPRIRSTKVDGGSSYSGQQAGFAAADRADLGGARVGAASRASLT